MSQTHLTRPGPDGATAARDQEFRHQLLGQAPFLTNNLKAVFEAVVIGVAVAASVVLSSPLVTAAAIVIAFGSVVALWRAFRHHIAAERVLERGELLVHVVDLDEEPDPEGRSRNPDLRYLAAPVHLRYADWKKMHDLMTQVGRAAHGGGVAAGVYLVRIAAEGGCAFTDDLDPHTPQA